MGTTVLSVCECSGKKNYYCSFVSIHRCFWLANFKTLWITSKNYTVAGKDKGHYYSIIYSVVVANETVSSILTVDFKVKEVLIQERLKDHSLENGRKKGSSVH